MRETLQRLAKDQLISATENQEALVAQRTGSAAFTIGYELEVQRSAVDDIPRLREEENLAAVELTAAETLEAYRFRVEGDGVYEVISPPARHPYPLAVATRGIVKSGWLPEQTGGLITTHVSIGAAAKYSPEQCDTERLIKLLRLLELMGGSSSRRLLRPLAIAEQKNLDHTRNSWNQRGYAGVSVNNNLSTYWQGNNERIELRTFRYAKVSQHAATLALTYYLTRALIAPPTHTAKGLYVGLEAHFLEYLEGSKLPTAVPSRDDLNTRDGFTAYFLPFADHLSNPTMLPRRQHILAAFAVQAAVELKEEFGMSQIAERYLTTDSISSQM